MFFLDRSRVLRLDPTTRRVSVHARTPSRELVAMERLGDGTIFATDFPAVDPAWAHSLPVRLTPSGQPALAGQGLARSAA